MTPKVVAKSPEQAPDCCKFDRDSLMFVREVCTVPVPDDI